MTSRIQHIAFVAPRFPEGATVGGAETLMRNLALRLTARNIRVTFLTTCAENHLTWENTLQPGERDSGPIRVIRFPLYRKVSSFLNSMFWIGANSQQPTTNNQQLTTNN